MTTGPDHRPEHREQPPASDERSRDDATTEFTRPAEPHVEHPAGQRRPFWSNRAARGSAPEVVKTSGTALVSLVLGVVGLCAVLAVVLSPVAIIAAIIGIILAVTGLRTTRRLVIAGHGVAVTGLVLSIIALVLAVLEVIGVATFINMPGWTNWIPQPNR